MCCHARVQQPQRRDNKIGLSIATVLCESLPQTTRYQGNWPFLSQTRCSRYYRNLSRDTISYREIGNSYSREWLLQAAFVKSVNRSMRDHARKILLSNPSTRGRLGHGSFSSVLANCRTDKNEQQSQWRFSASMRGPMRVQLFIKRRL